MRSYRTGDVGVTVIKVADFKLVLSRMLSVPEEEWRPRYGNLFEVGVSSPGNCTLVRTPESLIMVDPNDFALSSGPDSEYHPGPGYEPPPDLLTQLETIHVKPEEITRVVITHAHYDHFAGITGKAGSGKFSPAFPDARYYIGKADWESPMIREELQKENPGALGALIALHDLKMLELVTGQKTLDRFVTILPAPGESPGHQLLQVDSSGQSLYCVGDLFHHWVEVENPDWNPAWADPERNAASRRTLFEAASSKKALVIAGHMNPGKINREGDGSFHWHEEK